MLMSKTAQIPLDLAQDTSVDTIMTQFDAGRYALIDLHVHLDGSLQADDIAVLAAMQNMHLPYDQEQLHSMMVCPEDCTSLTQYLKCFDLPISVMQTHATIACSVARLVERLDRLGMIYAEIRFAPQQHTMKGLTQEEVTRAALEGLSLGLQKCSNGFKANLILSCMRGSDNEKENATTLHTASKFLHNGVCGLDLAGAESLYPTRAYAGLFAAARELGVPFTIHAGEAAGVESMKLAIGYGARRIGHGIRAHADEEVKALLRANDVCLCICPSSNLQTKALKEVTTFSQYPLRGFLDSGVAVCVNTDNMTVSDTTVKHELQRLYDAGIITEADARQMIENAIAHAFITEDEKAGLREKAIERYSKTSSSSVQSEVPFTSDENFK